MAESITIKVEPFDVDHIENTEHLHSSSNELEKIDNTTTLEQEDSEETPKEVPHLEIVNIKQEPQPILEHKTHLDNTFILPDITYLDPSSIQDGVLVTEEALNQNARADGRHLCTICDRRFTSGRRLQAHMLLHCREKLECHLCLLRFDCVEQYGAHLASHNVTHPHPCYTCGKQFKTLRNLENHQRIHSGIKFYKCQRCDKEFIIKANLMRHEKLGSCKKKSDLACHMCGKTFEREFFLKSHMKKHTKEKPYQCDMCCMFFKHKSAVVRHIQIHNGIRPFMCSFCNKTFTHRGLLDTHVRTHTGEKPYTCPKCNKKFSHKHNMLRHNDRHAKEKNLQCQLCMKVFPRPSRLIYHMRSHTNTKPFKCDECGKKFTHKSNIQRHYQRKHPDKKYEGTCTDAAAAKQVWEKVKLKLQKEERAQPPGDSSVESS